VNEQDAPVRDSTQPDAPLPHGAGSPLQPGPPLSVQAPIRDTTLNLGALVVGVVGGVILLIIVVVILIAVFSHR
jgi:hypothetical protein